MIRLVQTCWMCPEQYDAFDENGERVGYLRLRHGCFRVDCPDCLELTVYEAFPKGDGCFIDDEERDYYLRFAVDAIEKWIASGKPTKETFLNQKLPAPDVSYVIDNKWEDDTTPERLQEHIDWLESIVQPKKENNV